MKNSEHQNESKKPEIDPAAIVYGDTIYWITVVATVIVLIGTILTFTTKGNYVDPAYMLTAIWEGKNVDEIWNAATGHTPDGHWYISQITTGDGLTMFGIALGVFSVIPGIVGAGVLLLRDKQTLFGVLAMVAALITLGAMIP